MKIDSDDLKILALAYVKCPFTRLMFQAQRFNVGNIFAKATDLEKLGYIEFTTEIRQGRTIRLTAKSTEKGITQVDYAIYRAPELGIQKFKSIALLFDASQTSFNRVMKYADQLSMLLCVKGQAGARNEQRARAICH